MSGYAKRIEKLTTLLAQAGEELLLIVRCDDETEAQAITRLGLDDYKGTVVCLTTHDVHL